jgi:hypothetical protein
MNHESTAPSRAEINDEISMWTVGGGIITLALFPLAVPILVLTAVASIPVLVPLVAVGVLLGGVALTVLIVRRLGSVAMRVLQRGSAGPPRSDVRPDPGHRQRVSIRGGRRTPAFEASTRPVTRAGAIPPH